MTRLIGVYRAMLLRALEGYTADPRTALVVHALVFELAHLYGYGLAFNGGSWLFWGLIYGYAFQTSRSVAVPTLMHVGHNLLFTLLVWAA